MKIVSNSGLASVSQASRRTSPNPKTVSFTEVTQQSEMDDNPIHHISSHGGSVVSTGSKLKKDNLPYVYEESKQTYSLASVSNITQTPNASRSPSPVLKDNTKLA